MEITIPADDAAPTEEPPGRYQARLADGSVVWESCSAMDAVMVGKAYHEVYGFTVEIIDTEHKGHFGAKVGWD